MPVGRIWIRRNAAPYEEAIEALERMLEMGFARSVRITLSDPLWIERLKEDRRHSPDVSARYDRVVVRCTEMEKQERVHGEGAMIELGNAAVQKMIFHRRIPVDRIQAAQRMTGRAA